MAQEFETNAPRQTPHFAWLLLPILAAASIAAAGLGLLQFAQMRDLRRTVAASQQEIQALHSAIGNSNEAVQRELAEVRTRVAAGEQQLAEQKSAAQAAAAAVPVRRRVESSGRRAQAEQQAKLAALQDQVAKMQQSSQQTSEKLESVTNDVSAVKGDLASTRSDLDKATGEMKQVRGDMGVMSGLIATNGQEIEQLRRLGDRNIYEFTLHSDDGVRKVGDIMVRLEKANPKHNRFSVMVNADDIWIEKKDKTINEPVQFYVTSKARQPYELVVNEVSKHSIKGYLATPKVTLTRQTSSAQ